MDRPHPGLPGERLIVGQLPEPAPKVPLKIRGRLFAGIDLGRLAGTVEDETLFRAHQAREDPSEQHQRAAFERIALLHKMVLEFDREVSMYTSWPVSVNSRAAVTGAPAASISVNRILVIGAPFSSGC